MRKAKSLTINKLIFKRYNGEPVAPGQGVVIIQHDVTNKCHVTATASLLRYLQSVKTASAILTGYRSMTLCEIMEDIPSSYTVFYYRCNNFRDVRDIVAKQLSSKNLLLVRKRRMSNTV
jgi:hypothetical protein